MASANVGARQPPSPENGASRPPGTDPPGGAPKWICATCRAETRAMDAPGVPVPRCGACKRAMVLAGALAQADGDPLLGHTIADRFVVLRRLGAGSMGTVYAARQEAMARDVGVKILRSDRALDVLARQRFVREAKAMSLLTSPHTVTVFDFGEMPDPGADADLGEAAVSLYLAMELLDGESLGARLKRAGRLPLGDALRITRQALASLGEAHDKGVIHRDLKPDNLFLARGADGAETVKVLDFGIAKVLTDKSPMMDALETQAGTVFGTPRYMSPEQAQGKTLDARSDLYSLGVMLYQMLVGRAPFVDDDAVVVMARHIKQKPVAPEDEAPEAGIPAAVSDLVLRVLSKSPEDRPQTARAFAEAIDEALAARATKDAGSSGALAAVTHDGFDAAPPETASERSAKPTRPVRRAAWIVAGGAVIAFVIAVAATRREPSAGSARPAIALAARGRAEALLAGLAGTEPRRESGPALGSAAAAPSASAPPVPASTSVAPSAQPTSKKAGPKGGSRYKRFD